MVRSRSEALARKFDFEGVREPAGRKGLALVSVAGGVRGPDKYRLLDSKRRRAQMRARRLLDLLS